MEGYLGAINFNPVASNIPKWRMFRLLNWIHNLQQSMRDHEILYADRASKDLQLLVRQFFL
jgi:hypothetical protein